MRFFGLTLLEDSRFVVFSSHLGPITFVGRRIPKSRNHQRSWSTRNQQWISNIDIRISDSCFSSLGLSKARPRTLRFLFRFLLHRFLLQLPCHARIILRSTHEFSRFLTGRIYFPASFLQELLIVLHIRVRRGLIFFIYWNFYSFYHAHFFQDCQNWFR